LEKTVAIDPAFANAHAGIAHCLLSLVMDSVRPARGLLPKAAAAAHRALDLDETSAPAHTALAAVRATLDYDWTAAERHFRRALELSPDPQVRLPYALWCLIPQRRAAEAIEQADFAAQNDPLLPLCPNLQGSARMYKRDYEGAAACYLRALDIDPGFSKSIQNLSYVRCLQGRVPEALAYAERLIQLVGRSSLSLCTLGVVHAAAGNLEAANRLLEEIRSSSPRSKLSEFGVACIHALPGDRDAASTTLDQVVEDREPRALWLWVHPFMDPLRSDPRYEVLLKKLNFIT
jgi:tetratricopeptide (TPR) repeat protein